MSRKMILTLAAAATVAVATLASQSADARGFGGGGFGGGGFGARGFGGGAGVGMARLPARGGGRLIPILNPGNPGGPIHPIFPGHPGIPGHPHWWWWAHHHTHWIFRDGRWIEDDVVVDATPVAPGPCTCLT
jgi:hypothetical protein